MNHSRSESTTPTPIQVEDALRSLAGGVGQLDRDRAAAYGELSTLRSAKQSSLARREQIYAVKYGATDRRVLQVQHQRETNTRLRQEIYVAHTQAATPAPLVDENSYVFHGFVRNHQRQPLSRLTVALYDEKGKWRRELGFGCTDANGYFILQFARDAKAAQEDQTAAGEAPKPAQSSRSAKAANSGDEKKVQSAARISGIDREGQSSTVEIRVYDTKQKLLHRESKPLAPKLGNVDYREIVINDGSERCVPPPGSTDDPPPAAPEKTSPSRRAPVSTAPKAAPAPIKPPPPAPPPETPAPQDRVSTPLENIKGVGAKTAAKLRATGIKDIEALKKTGTEKLIELAGTDKKATRPNTKKRSARASVARKKKP
jgi:predicted flap endonuclease-1-like 5' DNA nuclease